jgi:hypothetical protein
MQSRKKEFEGHAMACSYIIIALLAVMDTHVSVF